MNIRTSKWLPSNMGNVADPINHLFFVIGKFNNWNQFNSARFLADWYADTHEKIVIGLVMRFKWAIGCLRQKKKEKFPTFIGKIFDAEHTSCWDYLSLVRAKEEEKEGKKMFRYFSIFDFEINATASWRGITWGKSLASSMRWLLTFHLLFDLDVFFS